MGLLGEILEKHLLCFGDMPDPDRQAVRALDGEVRDLPRFQDDLQEGDKPNSVVLVLSGMLYRHTIGPQGARQIHSFYLPGEAPCLETLYIDYMDNNLGAVVDSRIGKISHDIIYQVIDEFPGARKLLWRQTLVQAAIFREWLVRNSNLPAHASIAHFFCEMFTRARAAGLTKGDSCDLPLTQEFVAEALGMTPVHLNRTLKLLRDTNAFEWRSGKLTIANFDRLAEIADFNQRYLHLRC